MSGGLKLNPQKLPSANRSHSLTSLDPVCPSPFAPAPFAPSPPLQPPPPPFPTRGGVLQSCGPEAVVLIALRRGDGTEETAPNHVCRQFRPDPGATLITHGAAHGGRRGGVATTSRWVRAVLPPPPPRPAAPRHPHPLLPFPPPFRHTPTTSFLPWSSCHNPCTPRPGSATIDRLRLLELKGLKREEEVGGIKREGKME